MYDHDRAGATGQMLDIISESDELGKWRHFMDVLKEAGIGFNMIEGCLKCYLKTFILNKRPTPYATSFRRWFSAYHHGLEHPHTNILSKNKKYPLFLSNSQRMHFSISINLPFL